MAQPFGVTVLANKFPQIAMHLDDKVAPVVAKAALDIEAHAKTRVPVDTGFLKNSIQAVQISKTHWRVTVNAEYGIYVEFGTIFSAAQPYFQPAVNEVRPVFLRAMKVVLAT